MTSLYYSSLNLTSIHSLQSLINFKQKFNVITVLNCFTIKKIRCFLTRTAQHIYEIQTFLEKGMDNQYSPTECVLPYTSRDGIFEFTKLTMSAICLLISFYRKFIYMYINIKLPLNENNRQTCADHLLSLQKCTRPNYPMEITKKI